MIHVSNLVGWSTDVDNSIKVNNALRKFKFQRSLYECILPLDSDRDWASWPSRVQPWDAQNIRPVDGIPHLMHGVYH